MKTIIILLLLGVALFADNPKTYSLLGDVIYNNADNFNKLKNKNLYNLEKENIENYIVKVNKVKEYGFLVDDNLKKATKAKYLKKLRVIQKLNDKHIAKVHKHFLLAMKNGESIFFSQLLNSELVDINRYEKEIRSYYYTHKDAVALSSKLEEKFNKDGQAMKSQRVKESKYLEDKARINRIQANDKAKQEKIERDLEAEAKRKKREIQEYQKRELSY